MISHNSHVLLAAGVAVGIGAGLVLVPRWRARMFRRALAYGGVLAFALFSMVGVNWWLHAPPAPTRGGDTILLGRFQEMGVLTRVLQENCAATKWELCNSLDLVQQHDREWRWFLHGADSPIRATAQQRNAAPTVWLLPVDERAMQWFWLGALLVLALLAVWRKQPVYTLWLLTTLGYVVWNAFVMAAFSGAVTRYQARVAWLIPFAVLVAVCGVVIWMQRQNAKL